MKKVTTSLTAILFVLALGTVYAADNGITDFTGKSYDLFVIGSAADMNGVEGANAGGLRAGDSGLYNGVTDFSGRSYETFALGDASANSVSGESAGGMREGGKIVSNGVTDFTGNSYDNFEIGL